MLPLLMTWGLQVGTYKLLTSTLMKGAWDYIKDKSKSLMKALAWRAFAALNTLCTALFFTRKASASGGIMLTETIVKTSMFYAYERVWAHVPWGKVFSKPALGGKQLSAKFFQDQAFPTAPPSDGMLGWRTEVGNGTLDVVDAWMSRGAELPGHINNPAKAARIDTSRNLLGVRYKPHWSGHRAHIVGWWLHREEQYDDRLDEIGLGSQKQAQTAQSSGLRIHDTFAVTRTTSLGLTASVRRDSASIDGEGDTEAPPAQNGETPPPAPAPPAEDGAAEGGV